MARESLALSDHVKTPSENIDNALHISHLMQYVSAYEPVPERMADLKVSLGEALQRAKATCTGQIVDQDGEMFFVVNPSGTFDLCLRWKHFQFA